MTRYAVLTVVLALVLSACGSVSATGVPSQTSAARAPALATASPLPAPTEATSRQTPAAAPWAMTGDIQFRFDDGVTPLERETFQNAIRVASSFLGDIGPVTVNAYADFNAFANSYDEFYGYREGSPGSMSFRTTFLTGRAVAVSQRTEIWV